jgi:hypothetical protein
MNAKTATVRLYVAVAALLTGIVSLLAAIVRLTTTLVTGLSSLLQAGARRLDPKQADRPASTELTAAQPARPNLRIVQTSSKAEALTTGLVGLGFRAPAVKAFVASLDKRLDDMPLEDLLKEGLKSLSTRAA